MPAIHVSLSRIAGGRQQGALGKGVLLLAAMDLWLSPGLPLTMCQDL